MGSASKRALERVGMSVPWRHTSTTPLDIPGGMSGTQVEGVRASFRKWLDQYKRTGEWTPRSHAFTSAELKPVQSMGEAIGGMKPTRPTVTMAGIGHPAPIPKVPTAPVLAPSERTVVKGTAAGKLPVQRRAAIIKIPKKPSPAASGVARKGKSLLKSVASLVRKAV